MLLAELRSFEKRIKDAEYSSLDGQRESILDTKPENRRIVVKNIAESVTFTEVCHIIVVGNRLQTQSFLNTVQALETLADPCERTVIEYSDCSLTVL